MSMPSSPAHLHLDDREPAPDAGSVSFQSENQRSVRNAAVRDATTTYIGKSMIIKGEVSGEEPINVEGKIEGSMSVPGAHVNIGREAVVKSNLQCGEAIIRGTLCGNLTASDRVEVHSGGSLIGEVVARRISVEDGAYFKGSLDMRRPDPKAHLDPDSKYAKTAR